MIEYYRLQEMDETGHNDNVVGYTGEIDLNNLSQEDPHRNSILRKQVELSA